jgi:hypothetical protein
MDRKKFLYNLFGTAVAVTVGKHLAPLVSKETLVATYFGRPDVPGIGHRVFTVVFNTKWFNSGDILLGSNGQQYYLTRKDGGFVGVDIENPNNPKLDIIVTDKESINHGEEPNQILVTKLQSWYPEKDRQ